MPVRPRVGVGEAPNEGTEGEFLEFQRMTWHRSRATGPIFREDAIRWTGAMNDRDLTRRTFVKQSLAAVGPAMVAANALPVVSTPAEAGAARMTVVCVGAHPDDPESGCGGTLARYAALGHAVTVVYLTRGERGISGKSLDEAARIRSAECATACRILGAHAKFFGQTDGATEVTHAHVAAMTRLLGTENPDILFTHWPVDTHMDHQVASMLTIRSWMSLNT